MNKHHLSQREKNIVILFVMVAIGALLYQGVYLPHKSKSDEMKTEISSAEKKIQKNLRVIQKAKSYEAKYQSLLENFQQKDSDEQMMSAILSEIESVSGDAKIRITDLKPQKVKKMGAYNNFSVSLVLDGQLTPIMNFIYILQNQPHLFSVEEMRLDKKSPNTEDLKGYFVLSRSLIFR